MNLAYKFKDPRHLDSALRHYSEDPKIRNRRQRLEFLGDRVLSLVLSQELLSCYPDQPVGFVVSIYNNLVKNDYVVRVSKKIGVDHGDSKLGQKTLADCCEAIIGAIFLDGGIDAAKDFILEHWGLALVDRKHAFRDAKSLLQEWSQREHAQLPEYRLVKEIGKDHQKQFVMQVTAGGKTSSGQGTTKKDAEQAAAAFLLEDLES